MRLFTNRPGQEFIGALLLVAVVLIVGAGLLPLLLLQQREGRKLGQSEQVYHVAEAGINYYRWHLAHNPDDFTDGTGGPGPYVHPYKNRDGVTIGQYSLNIIPPPTGSTLVTIQSTGTLTDNPVPSRTLTVKMGIPSLSKYAVAANDNMRFGAGTETFGEIHSNGGIRYDAIAHGLVTSAQATYDDPDHTGPNEPGVHTHQPNPDAVFLGGRQYPVPPLDFNGITADLAALRTAAQTNGIYLTASGAQGYHLTLRSDDKVDMRRVTTQFNCQVRTRRNIFLPWGPWYGSWSISTEAAFTYQSGSSLAVPLPANGVIFVEDDIWVDGTINSARVTIVAARDPLASGSATIVVNNDLKYTNYDGQDAIGLIAQTDMSVGLVSSNVLRVDAAIIAQRGRAGRYYYNTGSTNVQNSPSNCTSGYVYRSTFTNLGSIVTNQRYGFAYADGTGYATRNLTWDSNLLFAPPPRFPTTGQFSVINWDEQN